MAKMNLTRLLKNSPNRTSISILTDIGKIEVSIEKQQTLATVLQHCSTLMGVELGGIIAPRFVL